MAKFIETRTQEGGWDDTAETPIREILIKVLGGADDSNIEKVESNDAKSCFIYTSGNPNPQFIFLPFHLIRKYLQSQEHIIVEESELKK